MNSGDNSQRPEPLHLKRLRVSLAGLGLAAACVASTLTGCGGGGGGGHAAVPTHTVGGTISSLIGAGLVLQNNAGDDFAIDGPYDGAFIFDTALAEGAAYDVTVAAQPVGQICTVSNASGTISGADVVDVVVTCEPAPEAVQMGGCMQGVPLDLAAAVTTLAGAVVDGSSDGTGSAARFYLPAGVTTDGTCLYVADYRNYTIRKIVISTRVVTTLAGAAGISGSADGTGASARFYNPNGITTDGTNLYVAETDNHTIRQIVIATGVVTTLAGSALHAGSADGTGASARFNLPVGITTDGPNLYVGDSFNHTIRKIVISTGVVTTIAGAALSAGSTDGAGNVARFNYPEGITTDGTDLYLSDDANHTIRRIVISTGVVTTLAGTALSPGSADGTGSAARFDHPFGITTDGTNLYVTDELNHTIRRIVIATGVVTTIAGAAGSPPGSADGVGAAARFFRPVGITTDGTNLYVCDEYNDTIRMIQ